ncbi:glycosyltransferase family 2 protein [Trinickia violacea]|uniref:Glycosyltransferase family 2 protein n=1 Tax=Trinickia violacea TaxID=2571746 RepID=A0A4P8J610_9BURK|nr:glycosyltransferase family 2 protein [Trinickia violacea]QCP54409.1 glycosyltransferase family 2 protein [Trinickia violacea]
MSKVTNCVDNIQISIGILLFKNSRREVIDCLNSIFRQSAGHHIREVLIRDQSGGCLEHVAAWEQSQTCEYPIRATSGPNLGFGGGHNALFKTMDAASCAYLCLNPDGVMHPRAVAEMIALAKQNQWGGIFEAIQEPVMHPKHFDPATGATAWCSAACILYPAAVFRKIGGFDDDFFMYCEDVDLSWRVKAAGFQCYTAAKAWFYHYAMDRTGRVADIWRSAYLLGHKWRAAKFKLNAFHTLTALVDVEPEEIRAYVEAHDQHSMEMVFQASPDFQHGLVFARQMWTE